jgi:hypothetical protein
LNGIYGWLAESSRDQKRTLLGASLGWMLDSMDVMLYRSHLASFSAGGAYCAALQPPPEPFAV